MAFELNRFLQAQEKVYEIALGEVRSGKKRTHWIWFIFPQLRGLGVSATSVYYGIENLDEAKAFLNHEVLGARLREISAALMQVKERSATAIFGSPDDLKLQSSMTLFALATGGPSVFDEVLSCFFHGQRDPNTLEKLGFA